MANDVTKALIGWLFRNAGSVERLELRVRPGADEPDAGIPKKVEFT